MGAVVKLVEHIDEPTTGVVAQVEPLLVDYETTQQILGISRTTLFRLLDDGQLRAVAVRGKKLIRVADLRDYVARLEPA